MPMSPPAAWRRGLRPTPAATVPRHAETIAQSHARCAALGLTRIERPDHAPLGRPDLALVRERNLRLYAHAAPVMEMLYEQIAGTESMVVLCDATGTIIHSIGDDDFLERAQKVALQPGVNWSEPAKGTNAIGTALVDEAPTLVHADEHFLHANHFLTCSASPIVDPRGNVLGVLDVTGDHRSYHRHTMALVTMSARMIENHWLDDDFRHALRLHFHRRAGFVGTLMEGIVAIAPDGRVVGANRSALDQLGLSGAAMRLHTLDSLIGTALGPLFDRSRQAAATPMALALHDGRVVHVYARLQGPVWRATARARAARSPQPPAVPMLPPAAATPASAGDAAPASLEALCTGDPAWDQAVQRLRRVLDRGVAIVLVGETGTGKGLLAHTMHRASARASGPCVELHCAAVPAARLEAALFGGDGDAGAVRRAAGGTLLLDEIDALPAALQARLLHHLRDDGADGAPDGDPGPAQVVVATRHDLRDRVRTGALREDLYYRLDGLTVRLPPLRERCDLPVLAARLLRRDGAQALPLDPDALQRLRAHDWPGNVRELANVLRAAALLAGPGERIGAAQVAAALGDPMHGPAAGAAPPATDPRDTRPAGTLEQIEIETIRTTLDAFGGNVTAAARRLGISRNTVYRRLRGGR
ncbi:sigma 54-interacting transcriptional regulator [Azohydromonas sp.]|uniref:sigma-54-dependent Fis family transcriptional regulator n=1 Tax=Azohydromonas sp. TaxID=1872666 RepID=UPI002CDE29DC|nr:sigma 54-interacting transcriptional regulator [Azohydromonas sp.]HMM85825.1 sigma 54-interacting transcriptional regulator [Azohydromonas sp.]